MDEEKREPTVLEPGEFCRELAITLVNNHLRYSLDSEELKKVDDSGEQEILKEEFFEPVYDRRVVVITGAGASAEAELLLANDAVKELKKGIGISKKIIKEEEEKLSLTWGLRPNMFETTLLACSASARGARKSRRKLIEMFGFRYRPLLSNEVLAHLLKHRFLDAIVNFNFDELLDQSIADELRPGEYDFVLSDGDLNPKSIGDGPPLKRPIYIKPHGTVSHPSTLRFTHEAYFEIPGAITKLLENLFTYKKLDLVVFGFSMDSPEVQEIVSRCKHEVRIFIINKHAWQISNKLSSPRLSDYQIRPLDHYSSEPEISRSSRLFDELWEQINDAFQDSYRPRKITRHQLLASLFNVNPKKGLRSKEKLRNEIDYLWGRTVIETCLAIARGRGFISIPHLVDDRAGNYYCEYLAKCELLNRRNPKNTQTTLVEVCKLLGMYKRKYSDVIMSFGESLSESQQKTLLVPKDRPDSFVRDLCNKLRSSDFNLPKWLMDQLDDGAGGNNSRFVEALTDLYTEGDVEIRLDAPKIFDAQFDGYFYLGTRTAIKFKTLQLLRDKEYTHLRIISEVGEWIKDPDYEDAIKEKTSIELILADDSNADDIKQLLGDKVTIKYLDWWSHNRHMTLAYSSQPQLDNPTNYCKGIFWHRRLRSPDLRPVFISGENSHDAQAAFDLYWDIRGPQKLGQVKKSW